MLSEKELLLLSNYLYLDKCTEYGTIGEMLDDCRADNGWIDEGKLDKLGYGGGMTRSECRRLLQAMDNSSDDFKQLSPVRSINEPELRAVCFTSPKKGGEATVVFRGTGGTYEAWSDNVKGEYLADTKIQKMADDFVRYDCGIYDNITVAGHSKGGNLAGYTTVMNRDRIRSCIAFDPQGFGAEFHKVYKDKAKDAAYNIKIISTDNDPVNTLLKQVSKNIVYVNNDRKGLVGRHGSFALFEACEFDKDGNVINALAHRERLAAAFGLMTATATHLMNLLPKDGNKKVSDLLAALVASVMSEDKDREYERKEIKGAIRELAKYDLSLSGIGLLKEEGVPIYKDEIYADTFLMKNVVVIFDEILSDLTDTIRDMETIRGRINYKAASRLAIEVRFKILNGRLSEIKKMLEDYRQGLNDIIGLIEGCEKDILSMMYP